MSKRYKIFLGTVVFMFSVVTFSSKVLAANPWDGIWAAIADLQEQITNIQLIEGPEGPQGLPGPTGAPGPAGTAGRMNLYRRSVTVEVPPNSLISGIAECQTGDQIISGGFILSNAILNVTQMKPSISVNEGWLVDVFNPHELLTHSFTAYAWCSDLTP